MNEILAPNDGATNLGLVDGINEGLACVRALTMAINPRNLDPESMPEAWRHRAHEVPRS